MNISTTVLRQYIDLPPGVREIRELLDDVGVEVKRSGPDVLAPDDSVGNAAMTLELLANRGDHHCYAGVAREISGRTGDTVSVPTCAELVVGPSPIRLVNQTPLCLRYSATLLELDGPAGDLPKEALAPLTAADVHSISPAVDATNLVNTELGQPTHIFDADCIVGGITVRTSTAGETALPLFAEKRIALPEGTLVIADDEKILAIAGVIGCEESKTTADSRRLVLESAAFDPVSVRKTSRALDIRTDSSTRFERGSDPSLVVVGAGRVVHLLESHSGARRVGATGVVGDWADPGRTIGLDLDRTNGFLDLSLTADQVVERLERYGFAHAGGLRFTVPPHRLWDVEYAQDLYEELAKSVGYNATPEGLPPIEQGALPSAWETVKVATEEVLLGAGFYEVFTDAFYGRDARERLGVTEGHALWPHVQVQNAVDRGYSLLKNNALVQLVDGVAQNLRRRHPDVLAYEWTRTFHLDPAADNGVCTERPVLAVVACGAATTPGWMGGARTADVWLLKGLVEEVGVQLGLELGVVPGGAGQPLSDALHPGRRADLILDGAVVGILGEVHPDVVAACGIKRARPVYLEITRAALESAGARPAFSEPPDQPPTVRNLAFTLPHRVSAGQVLDVLRARGPAWLVDVEITDRFDHTADDGAPLRTLTFALAYAHPDGETRTAEELNGATQALIDAVTDALGERGVVLR